MELIRIKDGVKEFSGNKVLDKFNISVKEKDFLGFIGGSGSGKSTVLKVLIGYHEMDSGSISFRGVDVTSKPSVIKKNVGFCTQENSFYPELTIAENMRYYARMYGMFGVVLRNRVAELLKLVELEGHEKKIAKDISGGMKRRLDFAISLIHDPEIVVFDEPTAGLDPVLRKKLWGLMRKINRKGKTVIITSHFLDHIQEYCKTVAVLKKGKVAAVKSPSQLKKDFGGVKTFDQIFEGITR